MNTKADKIKVWDWYIRFYHWALVFIVIANIYFTEDEREIHEYLGYAACVFILIRIFYGFFAKNTYSLFSQFYPSFARLKEYFQNLKNGKHPRYIGHNPLAAVMMFFLLILILLLGLSGYLMSTDYFFGSDFMEDSHQLLSNVLVYSVGLHVLAAIVESSIQKENLIISMLHGKKRK